MSDLLLLIVYVYTNVSHRAVYVSWFPWSFWAENKVENLVSLRIIPPPSPAPTTHDY